MVRLLSCTRRHRRLTAALASAAFIFPAAPAGAATPPPHAASGVYYEIFVRSFADSNGDGIGDLNGITAKLDYLKWLGVSGIWLTPIYPSASYHGYDITNYFAINPQLGTMADFHRLLREAHARGIKVLIDMVLNHTSDRNPWFEQALDPKSPLSRLVYVGRQRNRPRARRAPLGSRPGIGATDSTISGISATACRTSTTTTRPCGGR